MYNVFIVDALSVVEWHIGSTHSGLGLCRQQEDRMIKRIKYLFR